MRAISQRTFGGPEVLEVIETDRPEPGPGEVLVRVHAAGVNPADWKRSSGQVPQLGQPPFTLGLDLAGTVEAAGDQATRFQVGERVYGAVLPPRGAYAEYVTAPQDWLAPTPAGLDHVSAAALPTAVLTAWQALAGVADVQAGQRVLIHAAAGGVGHLAVQIAKARGAHIIATARAGKHAFLRDLGAEEVIDYTTTDFAAQLRDVDVVLDLVGGDYGPRSLNTLTAGGILFDVSGTGADASVEEQAAARGVRYVPFTFTPSGTDLDQVDRLVDSGALRVSVGQTLPLDDAAKAHKLSLTGRVTGKIVLTLE